MTKESLEAAIAAHPIGAERMFPPRITGAGAPMPGTVIGHRDTPKGPFVELRAGGKFMPISVRPARLTIIA